MKRRFSFIAVLLTSLLFLITSCSNASQVSFKDETKNQFSASGLSTLTVNVDGFGTARTIYPDNWTEEFKKKLVFHLTGAVNGGDGSESVKDMTTHGRFFTYEEIRDGDAKVELDPLKWDLVLTAYTVADPTDINNLIDARNTAIKTGSTLPELTGQKFENNKTLEAKYQVDLTSGNQPAKFDLVAAEVPGTTAKGNVDVKVYFNAPASANVETVEVEILDNNGQPLSPAKKVTVAKGSFTEAGSLGNYFIPFNETDVPAGIHIFQVKVLDAKGKVLLLNRQDIIVEGGNTSSGKVELLDPDAFGSKPAAPTELKYQLYFDPAGKVVIDDNNKVYALNGASNNETAATNYKIDISWLDNADNEYGYKLILTDSTGAAYSFTYDDTNFNEITYAKDTASATKGRTVDGITIVAGSDLGPVAKGTVKSVTVEVPFTKMFKSIEVRALNPYVDEAAPADVDAVKAATDPSITEIGMFAVYYNVITSSNGVTATTASVKYSATGVSDNKYFIMAYPYGSTIDDLIKGTGLYPYISLAGYEFGSWQIKETGFRNIKNEDLESAKLLTSGKIELQAAWLTTSSLQVTFPDYTAYRNLKATKDNSVNGNVIKPGRDGVVTLTLPQADVTSPRFRIFRDADASADPIFDSDTEGTNTQKPTASADTNMGIVMSETTIKGDTLTWTTGTFITKTPTAAGAVYRVEVSYTYKDAGKYTGNLYVDFSY